jgi:hypothetical protein
MAELPGRWWRLQHAHHAPAEPRGTLTRPQLAWLAASNRHKLQSTSGCSVSESLWHTLLHNLC